MKDWKVATFVAPAVSFTLPLVDLSRLTPDEREAEVQRLARRAVEEPFDLGRPPLLRATVLRLGETAHKIMIVEEVLLCQCHMPQFRG